MRKTIIAFAILTLSLTGMVLGQERRRAPRILVGSTALGVGSGVGVKNRPSANFRKRIDKATPLANLGDTGTHEVGHKGMRRTSHNAQNLLPYVEQDNLYKRQPNGWSLGASNPTTVGNYQRTMQLRRPPMNSSHTQPTESLSLNFARRKNAPAKAKQ